MSVPMSLPIDNTEKTEYPMSPYSGLHHLNLTYVTIDRKLNRFKFSYERARLLLHFFHLSYAYQMGCSYVYIADKKKWLILLF